MTQVYIQPLSSQASKPVDPDTNQTEDQQQQQPNVLIRLIPSNSTSEYTSRTHLPLNYLSKVQKWCQKQKFTHTLLNNDLECELQIEIFKFHLTKNQPSETALLKQQIATMRMENQKLVGEQKMFRFYYFKIWRERAHRQVLMNTEKGAEIRQQLIEGNTASIGGGGANNLGVHGLWDSVEARGAVVEEFGAKNYFLRFNQVSSTDQQQQQQVMDSNQVTSAGSNNCAEAMNNLYLWHQESTEQQAAFDNQHQHAAQSAVQTNNQSAQNNSNNSNIQQNQPAVKNLEVFMSGGCYEYKRATLEIGKMSVVNGNGGQQTNGGMMLTQVMVRVDQHVQVDQVYTVYVPKKLI